MFLTKKYFFKLLECKFVIENDKKKLKKSQSDACN